MNGQNTKSDFNVLLTGGSGFLGHALMRELLDSSAPLKASKITIFDISDYHGPSDERVSFIRGDIRNAEQVTSACKGVDVVIHSAAVVDWGTKSEEEVFAVNTTGTENVINGCRAHGVPYLVYTSSLDAIYGGKPLVDIDEDIPYPERHPNMYCKSKCESEKLVKAANGNGLKTVILRPSDIYGEGDPYHIGSLVNMAKGGFYVRLGDGKSRCQHVYADNMGYAHLLAAKAMISGDTDITGKAYFITDAPGTNFFHFYDKVVLGAGYRIFPKNLWIPRPVGHLMGVISEGIAILARPVKHYNPKLSRFAVEYTCSDFTFSSERAKRDFGYVPKYTEEEAIRRSIRFYETQRNEKTA